MKINENNLKKVLTSLKLSYIIQIEIKKRVLKMKKESDLSSLLLILKKGRTHKYWKCKKCGWYNPVYMNVCWKCNIKKGGK